MFMFVLLGFNRAFQASDGSCVCKNGYIYYDEVDELQSEGVSLLLVSLNFRYLFNKLSVPVLTFIIKEYFMSSLKFFGFKI